MQWALFDVNELKHKQLATLLKSYESLLNIHQLVVLWCHLGVKHVTLPLRVERLECLDAAMWFVVKADKVGVKLTLTAKKRIEGVASRNTISGDISALRK